MQFTNEGQFNNFYWIHKHFYDENTQTFLQRFIEKLNLSDSIEINNNQIKIKHNGQQKVYTVLSQDEDGIQKITQDIENNVMSVKSFRDIPETLTLRKQAEKIIQEKGESQFWVLNIDPTVRTFSHNIEKYQELWEYIWNQSIYASWIHYWFIQQLIDKKVAKDEVEAINVCNTLFSENLNQGQIESIKKYMNHFPILRSILHSNCIQSLWNHNSYRDIDHRYDEKNHNKNMSYELMKKNTEVFATLIASHIKNAQWLDFYKSIDKLNWNDEILESVKNELFVRLWNTSTQKSDESALKITSQESNETEKQILYIIKKILEWFENKENNRWPREHTDQQIKKLFNEASKIKNGEGIIEVLFQYTHKFGNIKNQIWEQIWKSTKHIFCPFRRIKIAFDYMMEQNRTAVQMNRVNSSWNTSILQQMSWVNKKEIDQIFSNIFIYNFDKRDFISAYKEKIKKSEAKDVKWLIRELRNKWIKIESPQKYPINTLSLNYDFFSSYLQKSIENHELVWELLEIYYSVYKDKALSNETVESDNSWEKYNKLFKSNDDNIFSLFGESQMPEESHNIIMNTFINMDIRSNKSIINLLTLRIEYHPDEEQRSLETNKLYNQLAINKQKYIETQEKYKQIDWKWDIQSIYNQHITFNVDDTSFTSFIKTEPWICDALKAALPQYWKRDIKELSTILTDIAGEFNQKYEWKSLSFTTNDTENWIQKIYEILYWKSKKNKK
jgi:hypothetical protein